MSKARYTIYAVEMFVPEDRRYHSYLMKVREDETHPALSELADDVSFDADEIHVRGDNDQWLLTAYSCSKKRRKNEADFLFQPLLNGEEGYINELWQKGARLCPLVRPKELLFDVHARLKDQYNCRSGTEAMLKAMGLRFVIDDERISPEGLDKDLLEVLEGARAPELAA
jgi:hypothetical protein